MAGFGFFYVVGTTETEVDPTITTLEGALNWLIEHVDTDDHVKYAIQLNVPQGVSAQKVLTCSNKTVTVQIRRDSDATVNPVVISGGDSNGLLNIGLGLTVILDDGITLDGNSSVALVDYTGFVAVEQGTFQMLAGSKITRVKVANNSGAVTVGPLSRKTTVSTFLLDGGDICNNITADDLSWVTEAPGSYGAVLVRSNAQVIMTGGTIKENIRGVVIGAQDAYFTLVGGSIQDNWKERATAGLRGAGICVGVNQTVANVELKGGTLGGNGTPIPSDPATPLPPGGELYVSSSAGKLTLNKPGNMGLSGTVCLTNTNLSLYPALILGPNFTNNQGDELITLDLASTRPEWISSWENKTVLKLGAGSTSSIVALKGRFVLGKFYFSSGNNNFETPGDPSLFNNYTIDDQGKLVLQSNSST